jgi:hypothetical protein
VPGATPKVGQGTAKTFTYTVEVEDGIDTAAFGGDEGFARMVTETLGNPKSWTHNPQFAFQRIDASSPEIKPDFRVSLSSPMTVREGAATRSRWSRRASTRSTVPTPSPGCSSTRPAGCGGGAVPG